MTTRSLTVFCATALTLAIPISAFAQNQVPSAELVVDGTRYEIPTTRLPSAKQWGLGELGPNSDEPMWILKVEGPEGFEAMVSGIMDPDPSIAYGISVTDFGAPSVFGFIFSTPIVPTGSPNVVTASVVGGLTDFTGNGVTMTPTGPFLQVADVLAPATNMGVDVGLGFIAAAGPPGSFYGYGPYGSGPLAGPGPGPWTTLRTTTSFSLSGGGDIFSLTGFASINEIPEPSTIALTLLGGLGVYGLFRRRN